MWIGEAINDEKRSSDVYMMKEDLHYLEKLDDEIIFSAIGTNEFIAKSEKLQKTFKFELKGNDLIVTTDK
ncbi:MAG: hypothetical protein WC346_04380 [Methanogenium sp.]|jgi:hypothetical protein